VIGRVLVQMLVVDAHGQGFDTGANHLSASGTPARC
jgi:hypothetical protein